MIQVIIFSILSILTSIFSDHGISGDDSQYSMNTTMMPSYNLDLSSVYVENKTNELIQDGDLTHFKPVIFQTIGNETYEAEFEGLNAYYFNPKADAYYMVIQTPTMPFTLDVDKTIKENYGNLIVKYIPNGRNVFHSFYPYDEFFLLNKTKLIEVSKQPKDMMFFPPEYFMYVFVHNPIPDYDCKQLNQFIKDNQLIKSNNYEIQAMNIYETECLVRNNLK